jgi:hypothetical protein
MSILSTLTKEEAFTLIGYLKKIGISYTNVSSATEINEVEHHARIIIPRLAFEDMEKITEDQAQYDRYERDGDMFSDEEQTAKLEEHFNHHHNLPEPQQSWQIFCNKISNALTK